MAWSRSCLRRTLVGLLSSGITLVVLSAWAWAEPTGTRVATTRALQRKALPAPTLVALEQSVFERINEIRRQHGLPEVSLAKDLLAVARQHSADQARRNVLTHTSADGKNAGARLDAARIAWIRYGENVALVKGYADPAATVVEAWMRSPGHAANILDARLTESAVGVAQGTDGTYFLTQVFVKR